MIDIHTHILPGLDDGASDWDETLKMARAAAAEGITTIIATPHHANGRYDNPAAEVRELVSRANGRLTDAGVPVTIAPGQEIRVHGDLLDAWHRGELLTLAGTAYVLIEMPFSHIPKDMNELIHELVVLRLRPILAHPERNAEIAARPGLLAELVERGAYAQMTANSLLGGFGRQVRQAAWTLCESGLIHLVSSDAHDPERRGFRLREAYASIHERMGEPWEAYYKRNAQCVVEDGLFDRPPSIMRPKDNVVRRMISFLTGTSR